MPTVKNLKFANGTNIEMPEDLSLETASNSLPVFASDADFLAGPPAVILRDGLIYINSTLDAPRMYYSGVWRTGLMQNNSADPTKTVVLDTDGTTTGKSNTLDFNSTNDRVYTFPDISATVVLTLGAQEIEDKTIKNGFLDGTKIRNGALDVEAAGALTIGATVGANNLTIGGAGSTVQIPGNLTVSGTTTTVDTVNLDVKDKNILINKGGNDALSEGSGLTVDRTGTKGSIIYNASAPNKFAAGDLGSEKNLAAIDDINVTQLSGTLLPSKGGTGVANNDAATLTRSGNHAVTLTTTAATNVTLPTTGTLTTLNGSEVLLNKTTVSSTNAITGALKVPVGTSNDRLPAQFTSVQGMIRYNTTLATFEGYNGTDWGAIGGGGAGTVDVINQTGHGFVAPADIGMAVYLNGSIYTKARADAANTAEVVGVISKINTVDQFEITLTGEMTKASWGLTPGEVYFLHATTPGLLTTTEPTVVGHVSLPVGVASSADSLYVAPKRGSVVGSSNARTQIALANNATTTVQNISAYDAGELTGWISITATTPLRFYVSAKFSKNGAGTDFNLSYQTSGDTPPTGFVVTATAAGLLQVTLPSVTGFASASINYALNAPAVGTSFPLSVQSSSIVWSEPVAFRNKIINGNFDIWQRGTSQTSSGYGSDDRWVNGNVGSTKTASRQTFTLGQTDVSGNPQYFSRTVVTSVAGANNYVAKTQRIEGVKTFAGQTVTLSFWAKADATKNMAVEFVQIFGTTGSPSPGVTGIGLTTCNLTTAWKKFTITTTIPSISGKTLGSSNDDYLDLVFWFDAGSSFNSRTNSLGQQSGTFDIAQVQLEAGSVATPFEDRSIGNELSLCERYYQAYTPVSGAAYFQGRNSSGERLLISVQYRTRLRANGGVTIQNLDPGGATITVLSNATDTGCGVSAVSIYTFNDNGSPYFNLFVTAEL